MSILFVLPITPPPSLPATEVTSLSPHTGFALPTPSEGDAGGGGQIDSTIWRCTPSRYVRRRKKFCGLEGDGGEYGGTGVGGETGEEAEDRVEDGREREIERESGWEGTRKGGKEGWY